MQHSLSAGLCTCHSIKDISSQLHLIYKDVIHAPFPRRDSARRKFDQHIYLQFANVNITTSVCNHSEARGARAYVRKTILCEINCFETLTKIVVDNAKIRFFRSERKRSVNTAAKVSVFIMT